MLENPIHNHQSVGFEADSPSPTDWDRTPASCGPDRTGLHRQAADRTGPDSGKLRTGPDRTPEICGPDRTGLRKMCTDRTGLGPVRANNNIMTSYLAPRRDGSTKTAQTPSLGGLISPVIGSLLGPHVDTLPLDGYIIILPKPTLNTAGVLYSQYPLTTTISSIYSIATKPPI